VRLLPPWLLPPWLLLLQCDYPLAPRARPSTAGAAGSSGASVNSGWSHCPELNQL
jgi:hypothetical protein